MIRYQLAARVDYDRSCNAAMVTFEDSQVAAPTTDYPIFGPTGEVEAVVTFNAAGVILGIELLNASVQLPLPQTTTDQPTPPMPS